MNRRLVFATMFLIAGVSAGFAQERQAQVAPGATLSSLVATLESSNPEITAARREIDMRVSRIQSSGAPPDPTLSVGFMGGYKQPPFFPSEVTANGYRQICHLAGAAVSGEAGRRAGAVCRRSVGSVWMRGYRFVESIDVPPLGIRQIVRLDAQHDRRVRVSELLTHIRDRRAGLQEVRRVAVSEVVNPNLPQFGLSSIRVNTCRTFRSSSGARGTPTAGRFSPFQPTGPLNAPPLEQCGDELG
jgi:hypothetical protein